MWNSWKPPSEQGITIRVSPPQAETILSAEVMLIWPAASSGSGHSMGAAADAPLEAARAMTIAKAGTQHERRARRPGVLDAMRASI